MNNKVELGIEGYELVKIERVEGQFTNDNGTTIPYKKYNVYIKQVDNPLVMKASVDKVFNDYVEYTD